MAKNLVVLGKWLLRAGLVLIVLVAGLGYDPAPSFQVLQGWAYRSAAGGWHLVRDLKVSRLSGEFMLKQNIGGLGALPSGLSLKQLLGSTGVVINEPVDMMAAHFQPIKNVRTSASAMAESQVDPNIFEGLDNPGSDDNSDFVINEGYPPVAIYCTHNAETYVPDDGQSRADDGRGLINDVGLALADSLSQLGFRAVFVDTIHDSPDYNKSYINSRSTVEQLLAEDDSWGVIIDVHRDSIPDQKSPAVVEIDGKKAAQILMIVGSDQRKANPEWEENLGFAEQVSREAQDMYPGLIRGVRMKAGTYNQDLYSPAILAEFGNDYNNLEQADYAADLFAEVLARVLLEGS